LSGRRKTLAVVFFFRFHSPGVAVVRSNLVHKMSLGELFLQQFDYADVLNRINLDDSEIGLLCAVMIFNPGTSVLLQFISVGHEAFYPA